MTVKWKVERGLPVYLFGNMKTGKMIAVNECSPPQVLSEASNSAGMRHEKNPQGFFDLLNLGRDEARRGKFGLIVSFDGPDPPRGRPVGESDVASARTDWRRILQNSWTAVEHLPKGGMGASAPIIGFSENVVIIKRSPHERLIETYAQYHFNEDRIRQLPAGYGGQKYPASPFTAAGC